MPLAIKSKLSIEPTKSLATIILAIKSLFKALIIISLLAIKPLVMVITLPDLRINFKAKVELKATFINPMYLVHNQGKDFALKKTKSYQAY